MLSDEAVQRIVDTAFEAHEMCGCGQATHALADAAHTIVERELLPGQDMNTVWNSRAQGHQRHVESALWRSFWSRYSRGRMAVNVVIPTAALAARGARRG